MSSAVLSAAASLRQACAGFEPELLSGADCAAIAEELAATSKACDAARLLASARAVSCGAHQARGFSDGAAWMARQVGGSTGQARQALETAAELKNCPDTQTAPLAGQLYLAQAAEVVKTESETPGAEAELLEVARNSDLGQLRDNAREHRQAKADLQELHRQQLRARSFRHWRHRLGMVCFAGALPPRRECLSSTASSWLHRAPDAPSISPAASANAVRPLPPMPLWRRPGALFAG